MRLINTTLIFLITFFIPFKSNLYAQSISQFRLLDQSTQKPIVGATYLYNNETGVTDENGVVEFKYVTDATMKLSHINYGQWVLGERKIQKAIKKGEYLRTIQDITAAPITVVGLRHTQTPSEERDIDFNERLAHDGSAVLNKIPAVSFVQKGGNYGSDPVLRGFKNEQLNTVINCALCAIAACPNRMDPPTSQVAPNMIDKVEILKGPYALRYGVGLGGTIRYVPQPLRFDEQSQIYGRFSAGYEGNTSSKRTEGMVATTGKFHDVGIFASLSDGQDYTSGNGQAIQADYMRSSLGMNLGFKLAEYDQIRLSTIFNMARDADFPALPMDLREDNTWMFDLQYDKIFDHAYLDTWSTNVFGSFVDHLMDNRLKNLNPRMANNETSANTYVMGFRSEAYWDLAHGPLYTGVEFKVEGADGARTRNYLMGPMAGKTLKDTVWQDSRIIKSGIFAEYHIKNPSTQMVFSSRLELNNATANNPSAFFQNEFEDLSQTQFNPSLSFGINHYFNYEYSMSLWLARVQRSPSVTERYINGFPVGNDSYELIGNPNLKSEVNNQVDLTMKWITTQASLEVNVFAAYLQNYISSVIDPSLAPTPGTPSPGVRRYINIDKAYKTGFEVSWNQFLFWGLQHWFGAAFTYAQDLEREQPLPEIAPMDLRYALIGNFLEDKLQAEISLRHVLKQTRVSSEYGETKTPSFTTVDTKVSYTLFYNVNLHAGINNLFDENYYEHLSRPVRGIMEPMYAPGRNFYTTVNYTF